MNRSKWRGALALCWLLLATTLGAQFIFRTAAVCGVTMTCYYLDPDVAGGSHDGSQANPWQSLNWTTINTGLASNNVTVYFSARAAGSDTNQTGGAGIHVTRTDTSTHLLVLDGMTKYNTNDSTPSWADYPARTQTITLLDSSTVSGYVYGGSRYEITSSNPVDTTQVNNSYVTVRGFKLIASANQAVWYWLGYHVTIEYNEMTGTGGGAGPGVYFVGMREEIASDTNGGACVVHGYQNCDGFENLTVRYNYIHETRGEGIYFGGVGDQSSPGVSPKQQTYQVDHNVIVNPAYLAGEGDAIDVKTMITGVTIQDNFIKFTATGAGTPRSCTETLSGVVYERNFCDGNNLTAVGLSLTDFWSGSASNRPGSIVRNNIIVNTAGSRGDIHCWGDTSGADDFTGLLIDNNTTYAGTNGIYLGANCTGATVRNNLMSSATSEDLLSSVALSTHSNNLFYKTSGTLATVNGSGYTSGTIGGYEATAVTTDPQFTSLTPPLLVANFMIGSGSPAKDAGVTIAAFTLDLSHTTRPQGAAWDIGALER